MKSPAPVKASSSAGVWIDHRKAQIVFLSEAKATTQTILSNVEKHPERGGDSPMKGPYEAQQAPADDKRQRAFTGDLNRYYDAVIEALRGYGNLLLLGPGEAKGELHTRLMKHHQTGRTVVVETEDKMTDGQVVAKVKAHFGFLPAS
jgi:hypothetical protein